MCREEELFNQTGKHCEFVYHGALQKVICVFFMFISISYISVTLVLCAHNMWGKSPEHWIEGHGAMDIGITVKSAKIPS